MRRSLVLLSAGLTLLGTNLASAQNNTPHNLILFVPDGLRALKVTPETAPTMAEIRDKGVNFKNPHSLFPTFTMANGSAMATGHYLGDTGTFSNTIFAGFTSAPAGDTVVPFLENDAVLGDIDEHFKGNYLNEEALLKMARAGGFSTAAIGKVGPALLFDHTDRAGGLSPLRLLPKGKKRVMPGFITTKTGDLEKLDDLKRKFDEAAKFADIAQLGYPSMNVLVVSRKLVTRDRPLVQRIVCAVAAASDDMMGSDRAKYFASSAAVLGVPADVAIKGSEQWPELALKDQAEWFGAPGTKVVDSRIVQEAYVRSAVFLKNAGNVMSAPSAADIAAAVDPSFVRAAGNGACK